MRNFFHHRFPLAPILLFIDLERQEEEASRVHHATISSNAEPRIVIERDEAMRRENLPNEGLPEL